MTEFTASNGVVVVPGKSSDEPVVLVAGRLSLWEAETVTALREYFQHQRDEELGRWRWPDNPDVVVYHARNVNGDHKVLNEPDGHGLLWGRDMEPAPASSDVLESAARAYFDSRPEPKPWHEAKTGEGWVLTIDGHEQIATVDQMLDFSTASETLVNGTEDMSRITAARRIWPVSDD